MPDELSNLKLERLIVHEAFLSSDLEAGRTPQQSDAFVTLDPKGEALLAKRLVDALSSDSHSIEMQVENDAEDSTFAVATRLLDLPNPEFIASTKDIAGRLIRAQAAGTIKPGICIVLQGTTGPNSSPSRFLAILKAEADAGFIKEVSDHAVTLKYINEMVLGAQQRLYKIGCFIDGSRPSAPVADGAARDPDDFTVLIYDHQMTATGDNPAARYFYSTFLGCKIAVTSSRLTKGFYDVTSDYIARANFSPQQRVEVQNHLTSYLKSNEPRIEPRVFADRYLPSPMRAAYLDALWKSAFPRRPVQKDTALISGRLRIRRMQFSSNVRIVAPSDSFAATVKVAGARDGWTEVKIKGDITQQQ
ncbi:MAG TPA: nucleoid-associated protein [Verrucomicrobiae bacterium]|nr:nucleoid-associated protein [Verrucomicrobiae bacterium]